MALMGCMAEASRIMSRTGISEAVNRDEEDADCVVMQRRWRLLLL